MCLLYIQKSVNSFVVVCDYQNRQHCVVCSWNSSQAQIVTIYVLKTIEA